MYKLELSWSLRSCPQSWINLIEHLQNGSDEAVPHDTINLEVSNHHGVYINGVDGQKPIVVFESEEDATAFVLSWS